MKRQYGLIDLVKFLCALLIVAAHYVTENATGRIHSLVDYGVSLYVIVVPFFFACGGYFLFRKVFADPENGGTTVKAYLRRIADRVADQSGLACNVDVYVGVNRANASVGVEPGSEDYYRNLHTNALASALY